LKNRLATGSFFQASPEECSISMHATLQMIIGPVLKIDHLDAVSDYIKVLLHISILMPLICPCTLLTPSIC